MRNINTSGRSVTPPKKRVKPFDPSNVSSLSTFTIQNPDEIEDLIKDKLLLHNNTTFRVAKYSYSINFSINNIGHRNKI